jgi:hypothetical protein
MRRKYTVAAGPPGRTRGSIYLANGGSATAKANNYGGAVACGLPVSSYHQARACTWHAIRYAQARLRGRGSQCDARGAMSIGGHEYTCL